MRWWMLGVMAWACSARDAAVEGPVPVSARDMGADGVVLAIMVPLQATNLPPELVGFERGFSDLISGDLQQLGLVSPGTDEPAEVAVAGQLFALGKQLRVDARLARMPPAEPDVLGVASEQGPIDGFAALHTKVARSLARGLGLDATRLEPATRSTPAVTSLGRALIALESGRQADAVAHLDAALVADPAFIRAQQLREGLVAPR